ncbi:FadR/GntR family transcriptional regulator [Lysinibacillus sp. 54212]|uniref:FadR/GntR family transcriptional regulator n=1 Tax=Lysinibacillus sp. 54212 TaxID=3119829 RepID=UPI002FC6B8E5
MEQKQSKKMFVQIVKQLRELIATQQIKPGEKLPSERVLCEQLNVGRSSVREALRSLELLGLIETRHGGGTFLADVGQHKLVEILSSFILQGTKSVDDVNATREMHEREAIRIICRNDSLRNLPIWDSLFISIELQDEVIREYLLRECIIASGNRLALKIWMQLVAYSMNILKNYVTEEEKEVLQVLLKSIQMGYEEEAIEAYDDWMHHLQTIT